MVLLDEVDAHLDQENVDLLSNYIKEWNSSDAANPQILMISHKESAVSKSDSLIGVTQSEYALAPTVQAVDTDLSKDMYVTAATYSLDLRKYH